MGKSETTVGSATLAGSRVCKRALLVLGASACVALVVFLRPVLDNIHEVAPDAVYRSAQLSPHRLNELVATNHIRAVLNLRGASTGSAWYYDEVAMTTRLGVQHADFELSAVREVTPLTAEQLVRLMEQLPKPLLIHCQGGADRTGLASALYLYALMYDTADEAARQLSFLYGHVPFFGGGTNAMDRSFWNYVNSHPQPNKPHLRE